jgi:hypothetical protein
VFKLLYGGIRQNEALGPGGSARMARNKFLIAYFRLSGGTEKTVSMLSPQLYTLLARETLKIILKILDCVLMKEIYSNRVLQKHNDG